MYIENDPNQCSRVTKPQASVHYYLTCNDVQNTIVSDVKIDTNFLCNRGGLRRIITVACSHN